MHNSQNPQNLHAHGRVGDMNINGPLRRQVSEVISHTANGCLSELGYHPGLLQRLKQADATIEKLKSDNAKIFADNGTLQSNLGLQNDRIAFHESSYDEKWHHTLELREKNHILQMQYENLKKTYEAALTGVPLEQSHRKLLSDLEHYQNQYRRVVSENTMLRFEVQRLTHQCVKYGLFALPEARPFNHSRQNTSMVGDAQDQGRTSNVALPQGSQVLFQHVPPVNSDNTYRNSIIDELYEQRPVRNSTANHKPLRFLPSLTIDTRLQSLHQLVPSTTSAPPDRYIPVQEIPLRSMSAAEGAKKGDIPQTLACPIIDLTDDDNGPARKKIRLEDVRSEPTLTQPGITATRPVPGPELPRIHSSVSPSNTVHLLPLGSPINLDDSPTKAEPSTNVNLNEKTDDEEHIIECVDAIIEEADKEEKRICRLCSIRHAVNLVQEPPKPWIRASMDELVSHCRDEHPAAWQQLLDNEEDEEEGEDEEVEPTN